MEEKVILNESKLSLPKSGNGSKRKIDYSVLPSSLAKRTDKQGKTLAFLYNSFSQNVGVESFNEDESKLYERLTSLWADLQDPNKRNDAYARKEHREKYALSYHQALIDYQDTFILFSHEMPEFRRAYRMRTLQRYETLYNISMQRMNVREASEILDKMVRLLRLDEVEAEETDSDKLNNRLVEIILSDETRALLEKQNTNGGLIDMRQNIEDIDYDNL